MRHRIVTSTLLILAGVFVVACGPDDGNNGESLSYGNNGYEDTGTVDSDTGTSPDSTQSDDAEDSVDNDGGDTRRDTSQDDTGESACSTIEALGSLSPGDSLEVSDELDAAANEPVSCSTAESNAGMQIFSLEVSEAAEVSVEVFASVAASPVLELRSGSCSGGSVEFCTENSSQTAILSSGQTYFLVLQGATDSRNAEVDVQIDVEAATCVPEQEVCSGGDRQYCQFGTQVLPRDCATNTCANASRCNGDTCTEAISIDLSRGLSQLHGDQFAYVDDWNAGGRSGCALEGEDSAGETPGADFFLEVSGHGAGDEVLFDATDSEATLAFYVLDACDSSSCVDAGTAESATSPNRFAWTAPDDQPVVVVVEVISADQDHEFDLRVSSQ